MVIVVSGVVSLCKTVSDCGERGEDKVEANQLHKQQQSSQQMYPHICKVIEMRGMGRET